MLNFCKISKDTVTLMSSNENKIFTINRSNRSPNNQMIVVVKKIANPIVLIPADTPLSSEQQTKIMPPHNKTLPSTINHIPIPNLPNPVTIVIDDNENICNNGSDGNKSKDLDTQNLRHDKNNLETQCRLCGKTTKSAIPLSNKVDEQTTLLTLISRFIPINSYLNGFFDHICRTCMIFVYEWKNFYNSCIEWEKELMKTFKSQQNCNPDSFVQSENNENLNNFETVFLPENVQEEDVLHPSFEFVKVTAPNEEHEVNTGAMAESKSNYNLNGNECSWNTCDQLQNGSFEDKINSILKTLMKENHSKSQTNNEVLNDENRVQNIDKIQNPKNKDILNQENNVIEKPKINEIQNPEQEEVQKSQLNEIQNPVQEEVQKSQLNEIQNPEKEEVQNLDEDKMYSSSSSEEEDFGFEYDFKGNSMSSTHQQEFNPTDVTKSTQFLCHICGKIYNLKKSLDSHFVFTHGSKILKCIFCPKTYSVKCRLQYHIQANHMTVKPFKCQFCDKSFTLKSTLKLHENRSHSSKGPISCTMCSKKFMHEDYLKTHINLVHLRRRYKSQLAPKPFLEDRKEKKPYPNCFGIEVDCPECKQHFPSKAAFEKHALEAHPNSQLFKCPECGKIFKKYRYLYPHLQIHKKRQS